MFLTSIYLMCAAALAHGSPIQERTSSSSSCSSAARIAAVKAEIQTIRSHTVADAAKIPLTPFASRTFIITPNEVNAVTLPPVNVGVTADTVRAELVILATAINAGVPVGSDKYQVNSNNTVTVDYVQTDVIALPRSQVREIHTIDPSTCQISNILGYVHGALTVVTAGLNLTEVLDDLKAGESVGQVLGGLGL
ncbi:hypothetical protein LTR97_008494 [Elasticomyces elasticus]|uniref:Uncharacterized protein n=1 Tax=Elasticomyces elasticus TaxID=574655 RepID=A0AAN7W795_9PEZI|nr:hypothetical protein LTR97_008494 [Elasticomyces elasticus]